MLKKNRILEKLYNRDIDKLANAEGLDQGIIKCGLKQGTMVLLGNPGHEGVSSTLIGQPAGIKVNANLGTSPFLNDPVLEMEKVDWAEKAGAHTLMDLSTGGDLDVIRKRML